MNLDSLSESRQSLNESLDVIYYCCNLLYNSLRQSDEELHGFIHLVVAHESIQHAAEDDVVGLQASLALHLLRCESSGCGTNWHCDLRRILGP